MGDTKVVLFSDSSMNIGGQELQALQQMRSLNMLGYQTILLCKPKSEFLFALEATVSWFTRFPSKMLFIYRV